MLDHVRILCFNQATNLGFQRTSRATNIQGASLWRLPFSLRFFSSALHPQCHLVPGCYFEHVWYKAWTCRPFFGSLYNFDQFWGVAGVANFEPFPWTQSDVQTNPWEDLTSCPRLWASLSCLDSSGLILVSQWLHLYFGWKRIHCTHANFPWLVLSLVSHT